MGKKEKLLEKARRNPQGLRLAEFEALLEKCGWTFDHQTGSHRIWYSPKGARISIQPMKDGKAKRYQVEQFLTVFDEEVAL
jgi:predicted RNA binding protein YcfA (HicA-like mRNA interferase family)